VGVTKSGYCKERDLEEGGGVFMAAGPAGPVVLKGVPETEEAVRDAERLLAVKRPNVLDVLGVVREGGFVYIASEVGEKTLEQELSERPPASVRGLLRQLASALGTLHYAGVFHGSLTPRKIFCFKGGVFKVGGFSPGIVTHSLYSSPEVLRGAAVTSDADAWSLGVLAYRALSGRLPFVSVSDIMPCGLGLSLPIVVGGLGKEALQVLPLLRQLLGKSPRPTARNIEASQSVGRLPIVIWRDPKVRGLLNQPILTDLQQQFRDHVMIIACETPQHVLEEVLPAMPCTPEGLDVSVMTSRGADRADGSRERTG
jgi:serine/threonine protein kinase